MSATFVGTVAAANVDESNVTYGPSQIASDTIEVTFNENVSEFQGDTANFTVRAYNGSTIPVTGVVQAAGSDYALEIQLGENLVGGEAELELDANVTNDSAENVSIETASQSFDISAGNGDITPFAGEQIAINGTAGDVLTIEHPDGEYEQGFGQNSTVHVLDTSQWEAGDQINVTSADSGNQLNITLQSYDIDVSTDASEYTQGDTISVSADASRVQRTMVVTIYDADGNLAHHATDVQSDASGELTVGVDSGQLSPGNYTAVVYDQQAWVSGESAQFTVSEEPALADPEFGEVENEHEGDVMEIPIEPNNDGEQRTLNVTISQANFEAQLNITVASSFQGDQFTINWNTYLAGKSDNVGTSIQDVYSSSDPANVTVDSGTETEIDQGFRLNPAGYTFSLYKNGDLANRVDSAAASVMERSTGDASVSIAPNTSAHATVSELLANTTDSDVVAEGDLLVVEQEVSGIWGYANTSNLSEGSHGLSFTVTNSEAPAYAEAASFNETANHVTVLNDADEDTVYFVIEVDDAGLAPGDSQQWEVDFTVMKENAYASSDQTSETSYEVIPRSVSVGVVAEPYQITPTADAEVRGNATLAPGHEITVEVDVPGVTLEQADVEIMEGSDGDHHWTFTHDFSDRQVGEEAVITLTDDGQEKATVDAVFNETPEWETVTDLEDLQNTLAELRDALNVDSNDQIEPAIVDLQQEISSLEAESAQLSNQVEDLQSQLETANAENERLQNSLDGANEEIADLESQVSDLQSQVDNLTSTNEDLQSQISELESTNEDLQSYQDEVQSILEENDIEDLDGLSEALSEGSPGFGPIAALIAILAGGAVAVRRRLE